MKLLKTVTIALTLIAPVCYAEVIASMDNQSGGKIVLTNETCTRDGKEYPSLTRAYTYNGTGLNIEGCYYIEDDTALIGWLNPDGSTSRNRYKLENFTVKQKQKQKPSTKYGT
tara:strand:+ start:1342 stop:1680 length:339 start_codon:yes stop_codon:yes gene_type:complete